MMKIIGLILLGLTVVCFDMANAVDIYTETRYQGEPKRDDKGNIVRDAKVVRAFKAIHPCPSTGLTTGACEGWAVDHVIPLACGGYDAVFNLQWLPNSIKSAAGTDSKDRFERKIYAAPIPHPNTPSCTNEVIK